MLEKARQARLDANPLEIAYAHLKACEAQRAAERLPVHQGA
jgi:hypothetical protein